MRHHASSFPSYPVELRPTTRRLTGTISPTPAIGLEHTWLWLKHNPHSTPLQRESRSLLWISNGYRIYTPGPISRGIHIRLPPSGLTTNWMLTLTHIWVHTWIYSPLEGILPQFRRMSAGSLRWGWRLGRTNIYPHS